MDLSESEDRIQRLLDQVRLALHQRQDYDRATAACQAILSENSTHSEAAALLELVQQRQREQQAQQIWDQAQALFEQRQWQEAVCLASTMPPIDPWWSQANRLSEAAQLSLASQRREDQARQALAEAEQLFEMGRLDRALARVQQVPAGPQSSERAAALRQKIQQHQTLAHQYQQAQAALETHDFERVCEQVQPLLEKTLWREQAQALLDQAALLQEQDDQAAKLMSGLRTLIARQQWEAAVVEANALLALFPDQPEALRLRQQAQSQLSTPPSEAPAPATLSVPPHRNPPSPTGWQAEAVWLGMPAQTTALLSLAQPNLRSQRQATRAEFLSRLTRLSQRPGLALMGTLAVLGAAILLAQRGMPRLLPPTSVSGPVRVEPTASPALQAAGLEQACQQQALNSLRPEVTEQRRLVLGRAQELAALGDAPALGQAIQVAQCAQKVPERDHLYRDAEQVIGQWSSQLWQQALNRAQKDDLAGAIATLQNLPITAPSYAQVRPALATWQGMLRERQRDYRHIAVAKTRLVQQPDDLRTLLEVVTYLNTYVPEGRPNRPLAQQVIGQAAWQIWLQAQSRQAQGQVDEALDIAGQIPLDTPARAASQNPRLQWQRQLLAAVPAPLSAPDRSAARPQPRTAQTSRRQPSNAGRRFQSPTRQVLAAVPSLPPLPSLSEDQIALNQARLLAKPDDPEALSAAMGKANQVGSGPHRKEAQALLSQWSLNLWRMARKEYRFGNRRRALEIVQMIPQNTAVWQRHARYDHSRWQQRAQDN